MAHRYSIKRPISFVGRIVTYLLGCAVLLSCGHSPDEPGSPPAFPVYIAENNTSGRCYVYYPETQLLDSFALPYDASAGLYLSPRGENLVACSQSGSVAIIDASSLQVGKELQLPEVGGISFAPAQNYLIFQGQELNIVSFRDYSVVYHDTVDCWGGQCNIGSRLFFFAGKDPQGCFVGSIDLDALTQTSRVYLSADSIVRVAPSNDGLRLYLLLLAEGGRLQFHSFDIGSNKSTYREYLWPPDGAMVSDPLGRYVFFSGAGDTPHDPSRDRYFRIFDVKANRVVRMISTVGIADGLEPQAMLPGCMVVTPDGNWLIVGDYKGGSFLSFNIQKLEIDRYVDLSPAKLSYYACQAKI